MKKIDQYLQDAFSKQKNNKLNIVAIDGFRMGWVSKTLLKDTENFKAVIPGKTLNEVNKILNDSFDYIRIGISKNQRNI